MDYPYSYHTFIFPFIVNNENDVYVKIEEILDSNKNDAIRWVEVKNQFRNGNADESFYIDDLYDNQNLRLFYNEYQYFHDNVRNAVFNENNKVFKHFCFSGLAVGSDDENIKENEKQYEYIITKINEKNAKIEYKLKIRNIQLKIYNTGVGLLIFNLENYYKQSISDIKAINNYGRRIFPPFISEYENCCEAADNICILERDYSGKEEKINCNFIKLTKENIKSKFNDKLEARTLSPLIGDVLGKSFVLKSDSKGNNEKNKIIWENILDDRMFTICLFRNDKMSQRLKSSFVSDESWYEFLFVDNERGCTCRNKEMLRKLLIKHTYARWSDCGTFHGASHNSLMCITGENKEIMGSVITPFITMYTHMAELVLVQRATIIRFSKIASKLSDKFNFNNKFNGKITSKVLKLQERYVKFQNQLMFFEVTSQEQGIEIYNMLQKSNYILREKEELEKQIHNFYEISNINTDRKLNWIVIIFAIVSVLIAVIPYINQLFTKMFIPS